MNITKNENQRRHSVQPRCFIRYVYYRVDHCLSICPCSLAIMLSVFQFMGGPGGSMR